MTYEVGGEERALTLDPDQVSCEAASAHGLAISNDPQGRFSIRLGSDRRGSVGVGSDEGMVLFEGTELDLTAPEVNVVPVSVRMHIGVLAAGLGCVLACVRNVIRGGLFRCRPWSGDALSPLVRPLGREGVSYG